MYVMIIRAILYMLLKHHPLLSSIRIEAKCIWVNLINVRRGQKIQRRSVLLILTIQNVQLLTPGINVFEIKRTGKICKVKYGSLY